MADRNQCRFFSGPYKRYLCTDHSMLYHGYFSTKYLVVWKVKTFFITLLSTIPSLSTVHLFQVEKFSTSTSYQQATTILTQCNFFYKFKIKLRDVFWQSCVFKKYSCSVDIVHVPESRFRHIYNQTASLPKLDLYTSFVLHNYWFFTTSSLPF